MFSFWLLVNNWYLAAYVDSHAFIYVLFLFLFGSIYLYIILINIRLCFILVFEKKVSNLYTRHSTSLQLPRIV